MACIRPAIASAGGSFPREDFLEKYRRCGRYAFLVAVAPVSVAEVVVLVPN